MSPNGRYLAEISGEGGGGGGVYPEKKSTQNTQNFPNIPKIEREVVYFISKITCMQNK